MTELRIIDVETHIVANPWKPWVFVTVETNTGLQGIAEATIHDKPETVTTAIDEMSNYFVGESPFDTEQLFLRMYRDEWYSRNVVNTTVVSAIDTACWDIKGKHYGEPLYKLLGGSVHGRWLRAYANGWYTDTHGSPERFGEAAQRVIDDGYDAMKFDPFGSAWQRMDRETFNDSIERVRAVREAVGPDIDLLIEGHGRFAPSVAVEISDKIAEFNVTWFEEPCPPDNVDGLRQVAEKSRVPIVTGERGMSKYAFRELLANTDINVVQPDLANTGGVTEGKKIAALAEAEHVGFAPHNPQGPVATAMCAHVDVSSPSFMIQEVFEDYDVDWKGDLLKDPITIEDGRLRVPEGPGLGVELDMDAVNEHAYHSEKVHTINLWEEDWETRSME